MLNRKNFIKLGGLTMLAALTSGLTEANPFTNGNDTKDDLLRRMMEANDKLVTIILQNAAPTASSFSRKTGQELAMMSAAWTSPTSLHFHKNDVAERMKMVTTLLLQMQSEDGTVSVGNLESPPDTAFLLESLTAAAYIFQKDNSKEITAVASELKKFLLNAGEGLITGGVHTPNHRWVISAALARLNRLYPDSRYIKRIDEWLAEGIFMDSDGHYPERSGIYSHVEDNAFITMGRLLNRPALFEPVRKNLEMLYYYMEPNGDLVTVDSRRQDQYKGESILNYYFHYRFMANRLKDPFFAAVTDFIETVEGFDSAVIDDGLYHVLDNELLQQEPPNGNKLPLNYVRLFATSSLLRIRRDHTTATLFGGADQPLTIASGRSNSPNMFQYRKGAAILKYLRLSTSFFSTGYFYSDGIRQEGNRYVLHKKLDVPYYQPLPKNFRKANGDYTLSPSIDGRFWNKMDFSHRPVSNVKTLNTEVSLTEENGACELNFEITGQPGVAVTIELCFLEGGALNGVTNAGEGNNFLEQGMGSYQFGADTIKFGPGANAHKNLKGLEGERYSTHFGSLRTEGMHVYLTGITPFKHTLAFS